MKKTVLLLGFIAGGVGMANAQTAAIKINPTSLIVATGNFSFEKATGDNSSFQIGAFYTGFSISDTKFSGFGITPEYRFYLGSKGALQGFFVGPYLRYQNFKLESSSFSYNGTSTTDQAKLNTFGGGVNVGYQWIFGEHFALEPFLRLGYSGGSVKVTTNGASDSDFSTGSFTGLTFLPGLNIGYAF